MHHMRRAAHNRSQSPEAPSVPHDVRARVRVRRMRSEIQKKIESRVARKAACDENGHDSVHNVSRDVPV